MSRRRATRPLMRYSLCPERYRRRLTTTSPGLVASARLSALFLRRLPLRNSGSMAEVSSVWGASCSAPAGSCASAGEGSSERISVVKPEDVVASPPVIGAMERSAGVVESGASTSPPSRTKRAASASSASSIVMVTSARPIGGRLVVPLKMQSAMRSARSDLWLCSPRTQEMALTTLDFPQPLGPTMQVVPVPLKVTTVRSQNDLKPTISTLRSLSKMSPFGLTRAVPGAKRAKQGPNARRETPQYSSSGGFFERHACPNHDGTHNDWQVLSQRP